jgi:peptidoglycan/LPS O-acetylase OafA/YrhL
LHGHWGVSVFFVLSGYCIFPGWLRAQGCGEFLGRRCGRIFPPYWASLLLVVGLAAAARLLTGVNDVAVLPRNPQDIVASILLLTNPLTPLPTVNWVYWTLTSLLAFYLVMGIALLPRLGHRVGFIAGLHGLLCLVAAAWPPAVPGPWFFVAGWPVFGSGVALAVCFTHRRTGVAMLLVSALHASWQLGLRADPTRSLPIACLTLAFLALVRNMNFPAALHPLAWIGTISFSLYLVHVPVGIYGLMRFLPQEYPNALAYISTQLLLLGVTLGAAGLFYLVAERPFLPARPAPPT